MNSKFTSIVLSLSLLTTLFGQPATSTTSGANAKAVRWHPGHYVLVSTNAGSGEIKSALNGSTLYRGIQKEYLWNQLERPNGWNFGSISQDLQTLRPLNKHLVIQVQCKAFGTHNGQPNTACPSNLRGSAKRTGGYYSGVYKTSTGSLDPVVWDDAVTVRMRQFYRALAAYLEKDPNVQALEAVCLSETAVSTTPQLIASSDAQAYGDGTAYVQNITQGFQELNQDLPHTTVIQYTNFSEVDKIATNERLAGVGLGGPDLDPAGHPGLQAPHGVYQQYINMAGDKTHPNLIPMGTAVQFADYGTTTVENTYAFGKDTLHLNYIFWLNRQGFIEQVNQMLNKLRSGPASGGLDARYPSSTSPYLN